MELKDQLFLDDPELRSAFLNCLLALGPQGSRSNLAIEQLSYDVVHLAVEKFSVVKLPKMAITGGLSAAHRRSTLNQITDRLGKKITLVELADAVHLSPYHFARMFKLSFGETPARFVDWMRIERAKALLNRKWSLSAISAELGYSHQSHMTQHFKHWVGVTPARYRAEYS
ncbi:MAG: helix-turn-helix transcriptional regulator [Pseudomonadota bacterium]